MQVGMGSKQYWIGDEAQSQRGFLSMNRPVEHGVVNHWDNLERLWWHTFYNELRIAPEEHHVLLLEPVQNPLTVREKKTQLMFETYNVQAISYAAGPKMSLFGEWHTTGVAVEIGGGICQIVPVYQGVAIEHAVARMNIGTRDVVKYFGRLLTERGISTTTTPEVEHLDYMLQLDGYVAKNFEEEMKLATETSCVEKWSSFPDCQEVLLGSERFRSVEALFRPAFLGYVEVVGCPITPRLIIYRPGCAEWRL